MEVRGFKFDNAIAPKALKVLEDGSVIATRALTCMFPKRFIELSLATIGEKVETIGALGFVTGDHYFYMNIQATLTLIPSSIRESNVEGVRYVILEFGEGDTVFENTEVVQDAHLNAKFFDEFLYYGKLPWYFKDDSDAVARQHDRAKYLTNRGVANSPQVPRVLVAITQRDPDNYELAYRYSKAIKEGRPPHIVGLNNVSLVVDGVFNQLIGGYDKDTTVSALLHTDTKVTTNEIIMKGGSLDE